MKILILSTFDQLGGAARSAHRLYQQLCRTGHDCRMLVQYQSTADARIIGPPNWSSLIAGKARPYIDALPLLLYRRRLSPPWSLAWLPNSIDTVIADFAPDIIHLHGVGHGFLSVADILKLPQPLVWTLHDSWPFTGGCHLPDSCDRYRANCGFCPQLNSRHEHDLSRWVWKRKAKAWPKLKINFVSPSRWLGDSAKKSTLLGSFPVEVIPNGIDTAVFAPGDKVEAKAALGLPLEGIVILFGASRFTKDKNKGFELLETSLRALASTQSQKKITLAVFGDATYQASEIAGFPVRTYGMVSSDEQLVSLYNAADVFVLPSIQENLPNTMMEAMACGTPCIAFDVGGVGDLIKSGVNGYIAGAVNPTELSEQITRILLDSDVRRLMGHQARETIEIGFSLAEVAKKHIALYHCVSC